MDATAPRRPLGLAEFLTMAKVPNGVDAAAVKKAAYRVAERHKELKDAAALAHPDKKPWDYARKLHVATAAIAARDAILSGKAQ